MRLLDTKTHIFTEFIGGKVPEYAILSHTWDGGEVTLQDLGAGNAELFEGFAKITGCCKQALSDGFQYVVSTLPWFP